MRRVALLPIVWALVVVCYTESPAQSIDRDSLRAELPSVVAAFRVPTPEDSMWVVAVRRSVPDELVLGRFNRDNPYFLTYLLENATAFRYRDYLSDARSSVDPRPELYRRLGEDLPFMNAVHEAVILYVSEDGEASGREQESFYADDVIAFAARFARLDVDRDGNAQLSLCAKSADIRERPFQSTVVLEAWIYSMVRPGLENGNIEQPWSAARALAAAASPIASADLMTVQRRIWEMLQSNAEFREHIISEVERRRRHLPFEVK